MADVLYTNVGGMLVAEDRGGVYSNYLSDTLGSVRKIFSGGASAVTDTFSYWPYGEESSRTGTNPTPFTWVGTLGYYKDAAKRFYVRMRSYLAGVGSWMTVDPLWPGERAYGYVGGRAVDGVDPEGLRFGCFYGNHCGFNCPGGSVTDGVDACCVEHDRCLATIWDWINPCKRKLCDCAFARCILLARLQCLLTGNLGCFILSGHIHVYALWNCQP